MIQNFPVFLDHGKEAVHHIGDFFKMCRDVISHVNRLFAVAPTELGDIRNSSVIQSPQRVLVEKLDTLFEANLDTIRQQVVLPQRFCSWILA